MFRIVILMGIWLVPLLFSNLRNIQNRWVCGWDELAGNSSGSYLYIKLTLDVIWVNP